MDNNGQPDPKRPRMSGPVPGPSPWNNNGQPSRELPPPPPTAPYPQHQSSYSRPNEPHPLDRPLDRRHSAHTEHQTYDPADSRRPSSGPHVYHQPSTQAPPQHSPYVGQQRDIPTMMKREPGEDVGAYRPTSTGSAPDHNVTPTHPHPAHIDGRYQQSLPPFQIPQHSGPQPFQQGPAYAPQSPMHGNEPYASYGAQGVPGPRDPYPSVSYPTAVTNTQKRKAQRAAQACDSCRTLKAKCDEGRPACTSCKEKNIPCIYRDPPPKQQDRTAVELLEVFNQSMSRIESTIQSTIRSSFQEQLQTSAFQNTVESAVDTAVSRQSSAFSHRLSEVEKILAVNKLVKDEPEETKIRSPAPPPTSIPSVGSDSQRYNIDESPLPPNPSQQQAQEMVVETAGPAPVIEEEEDGPPVPPGQPSIPVNHTTGAARLLLVRPISALAKGVIEDQKIKNEKYPMLQEEKRGLLRLFGRGEGTERLPGYERDPLTDYGSEGGTPSETSSDVATPPGEEWGQLGGLTPPGEPIARGLINGEGMPDLSDHTVWDLVASYKDHINNMHPILVPHQLDSLVHHFLRTIQENQLKPRQVSQLVTQTSGRGITAGFVGNRNPDVASAPDSPGNKRKRSPGGDGYDLPNNISDHKPGHPSRSIGSAIILLVMALGKVCQEKGKIPDCVPDGITKTSVYSPSRNGHPLSPLQSSPALSTESGLPSPVEGGKSQPKSRRTSIEGTYQSTTGVKPRNLDIIPGLEYFGMASDIIGNQAGGNSLQHVHANILASLYHGQLGRPLESHSYLHQACRSLQVILRPKLDRFKRIAAQLHIPPTRDNPLIFAFWTCLQLESDIVAELPVPHSGILTYEEDMPSPNLQSAVDTDKFDPLVIESYGAQLYMRKHLNKLHNMFYKPENDSEYPAVFNAKSADPFESIDAVLQHLENLKKLHSHMQWEEDDPPATDILNARLRAKYYGAKVITYRPALLKILEHSHSLKPKPPKGTSGKSDETTPEKYQEEFRPGVEILPPMHHGATPMEEIDPRIHQYAGDCIKALIKSTTAFHGMGDPGKRRLMVTNVWGTAHAQWGNVLTLQAAFDNPILKPLIDKRLLKGLYEKTMAFLKLAAQPSSALNIDCKILDHVAQEIELIPKRGTSASTSFPSTASGGDVPMAGQ